jgi:hypothetical protein
MAMSGWPALVHYPDGVSRVETLLTVPVRAGDPVEILDRGSWIAQKDPKSGSIGVLDGKTFDLEVWVELPPSEV